ncbi:MAG: trigger factor [Lachnospiraceae bacterium]|jgi:trigger factor|nr:trigger factor [Lachnospiraceae bacterium]
MSVKVENLEKSMAKLTITRSAEEFDAAIERAFEKQKKNISVPGFRKGKVPRQLVEKEYGAGVFYEEAANDLINSTYPEEAEASGADIVSSPEIRVSQLGKGQEFIYTAEVAVKPPVKIGQYKGVEVTKPATEVTDEEVIAEIDKEREKNAKYSDVTDRAVKNGDEIKLDFEGFVDGTAFEGGKGTDYPLTIGSGSFIPGFEEQLVGAEIGREQEIKVTFPEDYTEKTLAGKEAVFKCTVKSIREKSLPELDDAFADEVSEFSTLAEYKADVKGKLEAQKAKDAKTGIENEAVDKIIADSEMELPEPMIKSQTEQMIDEWGQRFQMQGLSLEQYFQYTGSNREKMAETLKPEAEKRIRTRLVLEQIVKEEKIEATEDDYKAEIAKLAEQYKMKEEEITKLLDEKQKKQMMDDIAVQKALDFVADNAKQVEKKDAPAEEKKD